MFPQINSLQLKKGQSVVILSTRSALHDFRAPKEPKMGFLCHQRSWRHIGVALATFVVVVVVVVVDVVVGVGGKPFFASFLTVS